MSDFLNPTKVIEELPLKEEMNVADFGCGSGGWIIPLVKKIKSGKIYAVDVLWEALSALRGALEMERIYSVRVIRCDLERGVDLRDNFLDLVIMSNLLFQVEDKSAVIKEGERVLKKGGNLLVVDWKIEEDNSENIIDQKVRDSGFIFIKEVDAGKNHFAKLYEKI